MTEQYEPTIALQGLSGFGWIDPFMQFPSLVRLPLLTTVSLVLVLVPH
ncbi:MAG: hypothetical protein JJ957_20705, partial [Pseudomonadales bacterium]|nr:hypothetical protein [Pseudomonadales bacterium]